MRVFGNWDKEEKASAVRILGLVTAALTVFILIACFSYLFHWKQDMSLLVDKEAMHGEDAGNAAGTLGVRAGYFLISELFGLGSFCLLLILGAMTVRLLLNKWRRSLVKTALIALFGAFISSLFLAYCGHLAGLDEVLGGGLGGRCGALVIKWAENLCGTIVTGFCILVLIAAFLFFSSRRFNRWFASLGESSGTKTAPARKKAEETHEDEESPEEHNTEEEEQQANSKAVPERLTEPAADTVLRTEVPNVTPQAPEPEETVLRQTEEPSRTPSDESFQIISDGTLNTEVTQELKPIDNRLDPPDGLPKYQFPSIDLLKDYKNSRREVSTEELTRNNNKIRAALANYKIQVTDVKAIVGPTVTLYKIYPAPGVKISEIKNRQDDIALSLNAKGVRVTTLSDAVGIEVANDYASIVPLKALLNDDSFRNSKAELPVAIGYTITQKVKVFDLADAPHLLIAGATKQGKSVGINVIVSSLLYSKHPSELKFVFIDPKMVEFSAYSELYKHYLAVLPDAGSEEEEKASAIVKTPKNAEKILRSLCIEMDERYELLSKAGVNKISLYNEKYRQRKLRPDHGHRFLPYIVTVVDEYADLTMTTGASPETRAASRSITNSIIRLAQKGRAAGLHVVLATQRPSVNVISGVIKSNFPMRIAFRVASKTDSMTILDATGADKLIGRGDMLFSAGIDTERIQCALIEGDEIAAVTKFIGDQTGYGKCYNTPYYLPAADDSSSEGSEPGSLNVNSLDERFEEAARMVVTSQKGSTSDLQRKLGMGYAKAGRVMDQLEAAGIVGPQEGSKPRQVLISDLDTLEELLSTIRK